MNDRHLIDLLGEPGEDPGCDACFAVMDLYAELVAAGRDAAGQLPDVARHLRSCSACREDVEGLIATLLAHPPHGRDGAAT